MPVNAALENVLFGKPLTPAPCHAQKQTLTHMHHTLEHTANLTAIQKVAYKINRRPTVSPWFV